MFNSQTIDLQGYLKWTMALYHIYIFRLLSTNLNWLTKCAHLTGNNSWKRIMTSTTTTRCQQTRQKRQQYTYIQCNYFQLIALIESIERNLYATEWGRWRICRQGGWLRIDQCVATLSLSLKPAKDNNNNCKVNSCLLQFAALFGLLFQQYLWYLYKFLCIHNIEF